MIRITFLALTVLFIQSFTVYAETDSDKIFEARKNFSIKVVKFDASQEFGTSFPYSDYVRLKITNKSKITLPCLTVKTHRYDASGKMIGSSRAPSIPTYNLKPGETAEFDYYPRGHLPGVSKVTVEIETMIEQNALEFIKEISGGCDK